MFVRNESEEQELSSLKTIADEFFKSIIQSEAEVRSKLIVPIIEWLGYPSEFRAEEFPVYAFEGSKPKPPKDADFILFDDKHFSLHRNRTKVDIDWVHEHSLLVFEAKNKGEMPAILGQPQFYSAWTKAVAYLVSDGDRICGYYYSLVSNDYCVLDCLVKDLSANRDILLLSFENTKDVKSKYNTLQLERISQIKEAIVGQQDSAISITESNIDLIDDRLVSQMRGLLEGKAAGFGKLETVQEFLSLTDSYLQNSTRYNIPKYMMSIPRRFINASLYLDNSVLPSICGTVIEFYRNEIEEYHFYNEYLALYIVLTNGRIERIFIDYHLTDGSVPVRVSQIEHIKSLLDANTIKLVFDDTNRVQALSFNTKLIITDLKRERKLAGYWAEELGKMKCIEEYYRIRFVLKPVCDNDIITLYRNVDYVYNGIAKQANCHMIMHGYDSTSKIRIDEPILLESAGESGTINMPSLRIHNYDFIPKQIYLPVGFIKTSRRSFEVKLCAVLEPKEINDEALLKLRKQH